MSGRMVAEVLDNAPEDLTQLELVVLVALAETARESDRTARYNASADALADRARSTPSSVRNVLGRLKERGLIIPVHAKPRKGKSQEWTIPKMTPATRRAVWKASPASDAKTRPRSHLSVIAR